MNQISIGLSGYQYDEWKEIFYPSDLPRRKWLSFYAQHFNTLEVNGSFYSFMRKSTYEQWYQDTPDRFTFSVKGHRMITQLKRLHDVDDEVDRFLAGVSELQEKLRVILWQFPANYRFDTDRKEDQLMRLEHFLSLLPRGVKQAFEFRHESCWDKDVLALLQKNKAASVIADSSIFPRVEVLTTDFVYIRLHGPKKIYVSSYTNDDLERYAQAIHDYQRQYEVFCYFNNTAQGKAIANAYQLLSFLNRSNSTSMLNSEYE